MFETPQQFDIAFPESVKLLGLFLKNIKDIIGATIESVGEWVIAEIFPSLFGVLRQGSVEKRVKVGC
jgi:hypothetical protein